MRVQSLEKVNVRTVLPEHRVLLLGLADSHSVELPAKLRGAFLLFAKDNLRTFPWREVGTSPYHLLLAELLLVQTKAADVASVWPELVKRYPTPDRLARATFRSLANLLRPLGLQNQRANAFRNLGRHLVREWNGHLPETIVDLLALPHVGLYAATAVSCFAYGQRVPIVDANVLRVVGRMFGLPSQRELRRSRISWAIAWALLPKRRITQHNYGLLDFAAEVCTPKKPRCEVCHIRRSCEYGLTEPLDGQIHDSDIKSRL